MNLQKVIIPESILQIDRAAFNNCKSLVKFDGALASEDGRCIVIKDVLVAFASANLEEYTIPDGVKVIGRWTFLNCDQLIKVTLPISVTEIQEVAFANCTSLTNIILPENITHIRCRAFDSCKSLIEITIPDSVIIIERGTFEYCESLKQFKGKYASDDGRCLIVNGELKAFAPNGINEYIIPNGVKRIDDFAFSGCENLSNITIANTVTSIGADAFFNCKSLTGVVIPNGVVEIEDGAFLQCDNLSTIIIPRSVKRLALSAFLKRNKTSIYVNNLMPPIIIDKERGRLYEELDCRFYVPLNFVSIYKNADGWSDYANQIYGFSF